MDPTWIPPQVQLLASRERELATIVYSFGPITPADVQEKLSTPLSNSAVRSMLVRLVQKGILDRYSNGRGSWQKFFYGPKITPMQLKQQVLKQVAEQYFDGSLTSVALGALDLMEGRSETSKTSVVGEHGSAAASLPFNRAA
jgi:predicted transcriptional regulator